MIQYDLSMNHEDGTMKQQHIVMGFSLSTNQFTHCLWELLKIFSNHILGLLNIVWRFPKIRVPHLSSIFKIRISIIHHQSWGTPSDRTPHVDILIL